jgi:hypothetical protein
MPAFSKILKVVVVLGAMFAGAIAALNAFKRGRAGVAGATSRRQPANRTPAGFLVAQYG